MIEFITKYWLEVIFGIIVSILSFAVKHYYSLWKEPQETKKNEFWTQVKTELKEENKTMLAQQATLLNSEDAKLQEAIMKVHESNENLLKAVLEVQQKQFKNDCKFFLESTETITFEQFENLYNEYKIYQSLGGDESGAVLFELVQEKYSSQMMQKDLSSRFNFKQNIDNQQK